MKAQEQNIYSEKLREYLVEMDLGPFVKWRENIVLGFIILVGILGLAYLIFLGPFEMFRPAAHIQENVILDAQNNPESNQQATVMDTSLTDESERSDHESNTDTSASRRMEDKAIESEGVIKAIKTSGSTDSVKTENTSITSKNKSESSSMTTSTSRAKLIKKRIDVSGTLESYSRLTFMIPDYNPNSSYTINFGDGKIRNVSGSSINHAYAYPGNYRVSILENTSSGQVNKYRTTLIIID